MKVPLLVIAALLLGEPVLAQRHVSIPVVDQASGKTTQIQADVYGKGRRALLLAHGGRFNKESWRKQAPVFARAGFLVLALNFRGDRANPDGSPGSYGSDEENATDVLAAVAYLRGIGARTISAIGGSLGGDAVGEAEARMEGTGFDRMVFLGSEGGVAPEKLKGRKLFIVAREDGNGAGPRLPGITMHCERAPEPKKLVVLRGAAHAQFLFDSDEGEELMRDILEFITEK
jgi:pimeloyl-ACP methyl ester carboxylesterase